MSLVSPGLVSGIGRVLRLWLDRLVAGAYAATVEVEGPLGVELVDARSSDALKLAALVDAPIFTAPEVLQDCAWRREETSTEPTMMHLALATSSMTINLSGWTRLPLIRKYLSGVQC